MNMVLLSSTTDLFMKVPDMKVQLYNKFTVICYKAADEPKHNMHIK